MNVLALIPDSIEKPSGGLGEQFRNMAKNLQGRVNYFTVGYPENNSIPNYKGAVNPIPIFKHASLITIYGQSIYFLKALEFNQKFDIIHAFDWSTFYAAYLCKQHFKIPLVCSVNLSLQQLNTVGIFGCHDPNTIDGIHINAIQNYFEELGLMLADKVIHISEYYSNFYPDYQEKTTLITNGIDPDVWIKKRIPKLPGKNNLKFCYIGRSSAMKGLDVILDTEIPSDIDFYFIVSPKNAEEPWMSRIKEKANNINIFHIPGLYGQDKVDFLYSMDGVVMPSKHEPFGIVALEALISENLFITTASGGIKEIVKDIDYFQINESNSLSQIFQKIKELPEETKINILKKGKEKALEYPWEKVADKLYHTYKEVMVETSTLEWY